MPDGDKIETHNTCTSNPRLEQTPGSSRENISVEVLNKRYEELHRTPVSKDPVVARIQREQANVEDKRQQKG